MKPLHCFLSFSEEEKRLPEGVGQNVVVDTNGIVSGKEMDAAVSSCCSRRKVRNIGHLCKDCRRMKILGVIAVTFVQAIVQLIGSIRMKVMLILCEGEDVRSSISPKIAAIYLKFAAVLHFDCWTEPIW